MGSLGITGGLMRCGKCKVYVGDMGSAGMCRGLMRYG